MTDDVDADLFRAVARSSPLLWHTVRLRWREWQRGTPGSGREWKRAWIRRPGDLRVETLDGEVVCVDRQPGPDVQVGPYVIEDDGLGTVTTRRGSSSGGAAMLMVSHDTPTDDDWTVLLEEMAADRRRRGRPVLRPDGLAAALPGRGFGVDTVPFRENYRWVAMLEPTELADGVDDAAVDANGDVDSCAVDDDLAPAPPSVHCEGIHEVDHHGRPALEALVTTHGAYDPRCGCCPLLDGAEAYRIESEGYGGPLPGFVDGTPPPDATRFRVRLDRATGICVEVRALDGAYAAREHTLIVEEVDAPYADSMFRPPRLSAGPATR